MPDSPTPTTDDGQLVPELADRRGRALRAAAVLASRSGLTLDEQMTLDGHLDDAARYSDLIDKVTPLVHVRREPAVYRPDGTASYFVDLVADKGLVADMDATGARARLARHAQQTGIETRATTTGTYGGAIPPAYLQDLISTVARAGRPFADLIVAGQGGPIDLGPDGATAIIPVATAGSSAATQSAETTAATNDPALSAGTLTVGQALGKFTAGWHTMARGGPLLDRWIAMDLGEACATSLDNALINDPGTGAQVTGILNVSGVQPVAFTTGSPTAALLVSKILQAARVASTSRKAPTDTVVMTTKRWAWICAGLIASSPPAMLVSTCPPDLDSPYVGTVGHLGVLLDDNVPTNTGAGTNQDPVIVTRAADHVLAETDTTVLVFNDTSAVGGGTGVVLGAVKYFAWQARRPAGTAVVNGTGLVDPAAW
jgi:hypothetical protein